MRYGSLFSGAGGLDLAIEEVFGAECAWQCEYAAAASKVLATHWPDVPNLHDVTTVDWSTVEPVDIMCGGFPCQDVSSAGLRAGLATGTRSGLWARFADAIAAVRPRLVVIENVRGLLSADGEEWPPEVIAADAECARLARVVALIESKIRRAIHEGWWHGEYKQRKQFESHRLARLRDRALARFRTLKRRLVQRAIGTVVGDLANLGYDAQWTTVSAASVGAPHKRERVYILAADTTRVGRDARWAEPAGLEGRLDVAVGSGADVDLLPTPRSADTKGSMVAPAGAQHVAAGYGTLPEVLGVHLLPTPCASRSGNNQSASAGAAVRPSLDRITDLLPTPSVADSEGGHLTRSGQRSNELLLPGIAKAYGNGELQPAKFCDNCTAHLTGESCWHCGEQADAALLPTPTARDHKGAANRPGRMRGGRARTKGDDTLPDAVRDLLPTPTAADADRGPDFAPADREGSGGDDLVTLCARATREIGTRWGKYEPAISRWEQLTRPAPSPTEPNSKGNPRLAPKFSEWMQGWVDGWATAVPGLSRNDQLRIIGNGVVTLQAVAALRWLRAVSEVAA